MATVMDILLSVPKIPVIPTTLRYLAPVLDLQLCRHPMIFQLILKILRQVTYDVCITVDGQDSYEQCFKVTVEGPTPLEPILLLTMQTIQSPFHLTEQKQYRIEHNGKIITTSQSKWCWILKRDEISLPFLQILIVRELFTEEVFISEEVVLYPNPTKGDLKAYINGTDTTIDVSLIDISGTEYISKKMEVPSDRIIELNLTDFREGVYFLTVKSATVNKTIKVIKS